MRSLKDRSPSQQAGLRAPLKFVRSNWLLVGLFLLVVIQLLISHPVGKRISSALSLFSARERSSSKESKVESHAGPWGNLEYERIVVEAPDEFISHQQLPQEKRKWFLSAETRQELFDHLNSFDLTASQRTLFLDKAGWSSTKEGSLFSPARDLVVGLSKLARQQIYSLLARHPENVYQRHPFTFHPNGEEEWFKDSGLSSETLKQVKSLLYQRGQSLCFSDMALFDDLPAAETRRLLKTVTRVPFVFMRVRMQPDSNVNALLSYWGKVGTTQHIKPLLEELAKVPGGAAIDVAHLLPAFARERLYTFPFPSDLKTEPRQDCFWTALNFFNGTPDDRFSDLNHAFKTIQDDYYQIRCEPAYGDLVTLVDSGGAVIHASIYVADGIVFTRNGGHFLQPWALMKISDMVSKYPSDEPLQIISLRSKKS